MEPTPDDRRIPVTAADALQAATRLLGPERRSVTSGTIEAPRRTFDVTKELIEERGSSIVESDPRKALLETERTIYHTIEDGVAPDYAWIRGMLLTAADRGKNFAVHAGHLSDEAVSHLNERLVSRTTTEAGVRSGLATTERAYALSIEEMERGPSVVKKVTISRVLRSAVPIAVGLALAVWLVVWAEDRGLRWAVILYGYVGLIAPLARRVRSPADAAQQVVAVSVLLVALVGIVVAREALGLIMVAGYVALATLRIAPVTRSLAALRNRVLTSLRRPTRS